MVRKIIYVLLFIFMYLFSGIYEDDEDDEFNERYFFIKTSPTYKWYFYSPRNASDMKIEDMDDKQEYEQKMYDQYVSDKLICFPITIYW